MIPAKDEFIKGVNEFEKYESRDAMYKVANFLLKHFWGKSSDMADGLGVLLLTWNQVFYRYGSFDFDKLETCINNNLDKINSFRNKNIIDLKESDEAILINLFNQLLESLRISSGKMKGKKSPVSVSKALHLLAPNFFPLWDDKISKAYKCYYNKNSAEKYLEFCKIMKEFAIAVKTYIDREDKSVLKLIDQYNYSKYTKRWI